jgi:hypothetical protein
MMGDKMSIRVAGVVGGARAERLFCKLAHQWVRGDLGRVPPCPQLLADRMCGLTSGSALCLFADVDSPDWYAIVISEDAVATM